MHKNPDKCMKDMLDNMCTKLGIDLRDPPWLDENFGRLLRHPLPTRECTCHLRGDSPRVCSHVAAQKTKKGQPLFTSKELLEKAANLIGLEVVETNKYNWFNRHMGDYPIPPGMKASDLGHNALFILRVKEPKRSELIKQHNSAPYDIGVLEDPNNPGCFTVIYDFWASGYGVDSVVGAPVRKGDEIQLLCPLLKQTYDMVTESTACLEAGDTISYYTMQQLRDNYEQLKEHYPELAQFQLPLAASDDAKTWVSLTDTRQRIGV
jgi:hypothetical protein